MLGRFEICSLVQWAYAPVGSTWGGVVYPTDSPDADGKRSWTAYYVGTDNSTSVGCFSR